MDTDKELEKRLSTLNLGAPRSKSGRSPSFIPSLCPVLIPENFRNIKAYSLPSSTLSADRVVVTSTHPSLCTNILDLWNTIGEQMELPPRPTVRILGQHSKTEFRSELDTIDFDLTLDITGLLGDGVSRSLVNEALTEQDWKKIQANDPLARLKRCVEAFCGGISESRSLTITRKVANWETAYLEGLIRAMISTTKYQGLLTISFPITFSKVVIRTATPPIDNSHSQSKWLSKIAITKSGTPTPNDEDPDPSAIRLELLDCVWPYASLPACVDGRRCAVQSEIEWWDVWKDAVRNAVLAGRVGRVTVEDWMDSAMGLVEEEKKKVWGMDAKKRV